MLHSKTVGRHVWSEASKATRLRHQHILLQHSPLISTSVRLRLLSSNGSLPRLYATASSTERARESSSSFHEPPPSIPRKPKVELHPAPKKLSENGRSSVTSTPISTPSTSPDTSTTPTPSQSSSAESTVNSSNTSGTQSSPYPKTSSAIQTAIEDLRKAEQDGIFTPPPEGAGKVGKGWHQLKQLAKFYFRGLKLMVAHRKTVMEIKKRLRDESSDGKPANMTRWESQFIRTYRQDQIKLVPFVLILLTLEELIPLIAIYAPSLLPSTCILPSQQERMDEQAETNRTAAIADIKGWLQRHNINALKVMGENLSSLDSGLYKPICRMFAVAGWGPALLQRRRLQNHLRYLAEDDTLLEREGSGARLNENELRWALRERGFLTKSLRDTELRPLLAKWINSAPKQGRIPSVLSYAGGYPIS